MRLPRVLRLDASDAFVFPRAAEAGEWAVSGAFVFGAPETLDAKMRAAYRSGFLGLTSFGWATLVEVAEADAEERDRAVAALAGFLLREMGAPDLDAAMAAAEEEVGFAESVCDLPVGTVIAVQRDAERERFRTLARRAGAAAPVFGWVDEA